MRGARQAIDWYTEVFAARLRGGLYEGPDGSIGHAELAIGDAVLMLSDPWLEGGVDAPSRAGRTATRCTCRSTTSTARSAGRPTRAPSSSASRRTSPTVGWRRCSIRSAIAGCSTSRHGRRRRVAHGDIGYVTLSVPDDERAKAFYGAVLGWQFTPGNVPRGWQIEGRTPMMGMHGERGAVPVGRRCATASPTWPTAIERVRAAGGEADDPQPQPYGLLAYCTDDQGIPFQLWQPTD